MAIEKQTLYGGKKRLRPHEEPEGPKSKKRLFQNVWFEGYSVREETGKNGKTRYVRVYTGAYYAPDVSRRKWIALKFTYAALYAAAAIRFLLAGSTQLQGGGEKLMALAQGICAVCMLWLLRRLFSYVTAGRTMTTGEYKLTSKSLIRTAKAAALGFACAAAAGLAQPLFGAVDWAAAVLDMVRYLCCGLCVAVIAVVETKLKYRKIPNSADPQKDLQDARSEEVL